LLFDYTVIYVFDVIDIAPSCESMSGRIKGNKPGLTGGEKGYRRFWSDQSPIF
jgi:hypothetical protein